MLPWILCAGLFLFVVVLSLRILSIHSSMKEIEKNFEECVHMDTNMLVTVSSGDRHIRMLCMQINEQLRELRKKHIQYETGDKELKEAVTNISHDLRTPLTAISGYLELLEKEEKSDDVSRYLDAIKNRTQTMQELTEELFRYTVILSSEELELSTIDVRKILENSLLTFYGALTEQKITPEIQFPEDAVLCVGNERALGRVFGNILNNALKYSDGDLVVELSGDGTVIFSNSAKELNGVDVAKLFHRFYTVETAHHSTGLGLSIAQNLLQQMEGTIEALYVNGRIQIRLQLKPAKVTEDE